MLPLTSSRPKVMLPIGGKPILAAPRQACLGNPNLSPFLDISWC
ncbi:MAG TPA: hypothetical protein PLY09_03375 [Methanothrix sp.]|nr:hypothetical protein [Methanothrix sp.]HPJ83783.1 hypothetical protein [Methanothrix sp.]